MYQSSDIEPILMSRNRRNSFCPPFAAPSTIFAATENAARLA